MNRVESFFRDLDDIWKDLPVDIVLRVIGASALSLRYGYERGTKDADILELGAGEKRLEDIAGQGTDLHKRSGMYIEIVREAILFLPPRPIFHDATRMKNFRVVVLDPVDVALSKLWRFHSNDAADIQMLVNDGHLDHELLVRRFEQAVGWFSLDPRRGRLGHCLRNLNTVERDYFGVEESQIELPDESR